MFFNQKAVRRFTRQLTMLLEEEVPMLQALELLSLQQRSKRWRNRVLGIRAAIRRGDTITAAFSRHKVFSKDYQATLVWAERTGSGDDLLIALRLLSDDTTSRFPRPTFLHKEKIDMDW